MASKHPVIRISIPTQVSYALGLAFQQSMIHTLRRKNQTLSEDEQTRKIMSVLNIKEVPISQQQRDTDCDTDCDTAWGQEFEELDYAKHIRERVNNSKCPAASSSDSGSESGYDDDDDDDQPSVSSDEASRTQ